MNNSPYSRRAVSALVLSADALGAALLGAALELEGYRAAFQGASETASETVRRIKPGVVLLDARDEDLREPGVLGPAMMTGARLVFFGTTGALRDFTVLASQTQATLMVLPDDVDRLPALLATRGSSGRPSAR